MAVARNAVLAEALDAIGARPDGAHRLRSRNQLWLVDHPSGPVVLRRHDAALRPPDAPASRRDIEWVHRFLAQLEPSGFPAPRPAPVFAGFSVATIGDSLWEAVTHLAGSTVKWSRRPSMQQLGAFLATFHDITTELPTPDQRPVCHPIASLPAAGAAEQEGLAEVIADLGHDLDRLHHGAAHRSVIHGDFTAHNVLAGGDPLVPVGVIDFANVYVEATLADIAFGLWRSGRPSQRASTFDVDRIVSFVAGYSSVRPLEPSDAAAIVVYLRARGVQIMVKQARRGIVDAGPLRKIRWLSENGDELQRRLERSLG